MFKSVFIGAVVLAVASALNVYELDNLIEYEDMPIRRIMPYPYQDNRVHLMESDEVSRYEPVRRYEPISKYEPVRVQIPEVPVTAVVVPKTGIISSIVSSIISVVKSAISCILNNIHALIFGSLSAIGVCKYTPICDKLAFISSFSEATREFKSFATPERIKRASEFVKEAIKKYQSLQKK